MKLFVCIKHVPDTAARIAVQDRCAIDEAVTFIMNPYDENALAEAVRLKQQLSGAEVIAVTLGKSGAEATLRSALAMGADGGILVRCQALPDAICTARALTLAIEQSGPADIIFTGKEAIDSHGFQIPFRIAALLKMPVASQVVSFAYENGRVTVASEMEAGDRAHYEIPLPCVVGAAKGLNQPNYPTLPAILKAKKKHIHCIDYENMDFDKPQSSVECLRMTPAVEKRSPVELTGSPDEIAAQLIQILKEKAKVLS